MDIKLKNKTKAGVIAMLLVCVGAAAIMLSLYPYFDRQAAKYIKSDSAHVQNELAGYSNMINEYNYVLYLKAMEAESGTVQEPSALFIPKLSGLDTSQDEELTYFVEEIESAATEQYQHWESGLNNAASQWLEFEVLNSEGEKIIGSREERLDFEWEKDKDGNSVIAALVVRYDENGTMTIEKSRGFTEEQLRRITEQNVVTPLDYSNIRNSRFFYMADLTFENPRNVIFVYSFADSYVYSAAESTIRAYEYGNMVFLFTLIISALLILVSWLLPLIPVLKISGWKLFKAPFELLAIVFFFMMPTGWVMYSLVAAANMGEIAKLIAGLDLISSREAINTVVMICNLALWFLYFFVVYWLGTCSRGLFELGFVRYFKERTVLYAVYAAMKRTAIRFFNGLLRIDFSQKATKLIVKIVLVNFVVLMLICSLWFVGIGALVIYSVLLFIFLRKYHAQLKFQYNELLRATNQIAEGNLDVVLAEDLGLFEPFRREIEKIQYGFKKAVEEEVKSQSMKTELITNVSHDLKTPLTAIITYVSLLKEEGVAPEQQTEYIDILERKSMRLKTLIEDLFEVSKANSQNITLQIEEVDMISLLKEVKVELEDKIEESGIEFKWLLPDERVTLMLDGQKMYRVFENLLLNITKYAMSGSRAYVLAEAGENVVITFKNVSAEELDIQGCDFTERFVRGDKSRNSEGSGLGLAIAKSFVEALGGSLKVETEADLFKVSIVFKR